MNTSSTGRQRLACTACSKRKIKCNKEYPCENCVKRGRQRSCRRSGEEERSVSPETEMHSHPLLLSSSAASSLPAGGGQLVDVLAQRVGHLESALTKALSAIERLTGQLDAESTGDGLADSIQPPALATRDRSRSGTKSPESAARDDHDMEDAATILEFLAWGQKKNADSSAVSTSITQENNAQGWRRQASEQTAMSAVEKAQLEYVDGLLPPQHQVRAIVQYHCECLLWYDGTFHAGSFVKELEEFYIRYHGSVRHPSVDPLWIALLLSILASSIACASPSTISLWNYGPEEAFHLAQNLFEGAITSLIVGDYLSRPCLHSVQCIATLTLPAHLLGHSTRQSVMIATAIKIAQSLNMHRLKPETEVDVPVLIERETRRRVWCQLATQDFFSTPFSESHTINLALTTTEKPQNCHDSNMKALPDNVPTITSFCRFKYDIAILLPQLQDAMASVSTIYAKYEHVLKYDSKMRSLAMTGRPPFLGPGLLDESWPRWIPWARRSLRISSAHKIIMVHRKFIGPSFTNPAFAFTRRTCIAAARTILRCQKDEIDEASPILWIEHAFVVTACIILWLGLQNHSGDEEERDTAHQEVTDAVRILGTAKRSKIAQRGETLLQALLKRTQETSKQSGIPLSGKRKRQSSGTARPRSSSMRFDTVEFANEFLERQNANERHHAVASRIPIRPVETLNNFDSQEDEFLLGPYLDFGDGMYSDGTEWMQTAFESPEFVNNLLSFA